MHYKNIKEPELINKVAKDYFSAYDCTRAETDYIDFWVTDKKETDKIILWAEAKRNIGNTENMFTQLVLTIGKHSVFNKFVPPAFIGVFDAEKIVFVLYDNIHKLFYENDFNWKKITPSNQKTKEFYQAKEFIKYILEREKHEYKFGEDDRELKFFIKNNIVQGTENYKIQIDKDNVEAIFHRWQKKVKPLIDFDFEKDKTYEFLESNFFLADLFVEDNDTITIADHVTIKDDLFVIFKESRYKIYKENLKQLIDADIEIKNKPAFENFWKRYKLPPAKHYQDYILKRKDLFVPADFRQRKGAYFTPQIWVNLSQKYISDVLGENWQEKYYVWDCCAGTGNLLVGLTNSHNIYASTLDQGDVTSMKELNKNTEKMFEEHIFQFDFLNDDFFDTEQKLYDQYGKKVETRKTKSKLPKSLQDILSDPEERKKLVIYINPPYAEAGNSSTMMNVNKNNNQTQEEDKTKKHKTNVATNNKTYEKYRKEIGSASNEMFAQFLYRIYCEIPHCILANFSTLKNLQGSNFLYFREKFRAKLEKIFIVPGNTFDNVGGNFPIGFFVWNTEKKEKFNGITADVYNENGILFAKKNIHELGKYRINNWLANYKVKNQNNSIGFLVPARNDFKNKKLTYTINTNKKQPDKRGTWINALNIIPCVVYLAVHHFTERTWINHENQFLYPSDSWENDIEFHNDCLAFALFHEKNRITSKEGTNHWIPFTEKQVGVNKQPFESTFMTDFISGKIIIEAEQTQNGLFIEEQQSWQTPQKRIFSKEAEDVFKAGEELWRYYHSQKGNDIDTNASLYDIRAYFQGRSQKTQHMNKTSDDKQYTYINELRKEKLKILADKIAEKVYLHGFLKN